MAAYDVWIEAFRTNRIDPLGHAYNSFLTEARQHAVQFLHRLKRDDKASGGRERVWNGLVDEAIRHYSEAHRCFFALYPSFPYGLGRINMNINEQAVEMLMRAKHAEERGVRTLEKLLCCLN